MDKSFLENLTSLGVTPDELVKAVTASQQTGRDFNNTTADGIGQLKIESLNGTIKVLEGTMKNLRLWGMMPKKTIENTVHEYIQLVKYSNIGRSFYAEGTLPDEDNSQYRRKSVNIKFQGITGGATMPSLAMRIVGKKDNGYQLEVENKTLALLRLVTQNITNANDSFSDLQFKGLHQLHREGIDDIVGAGANLDTYENDSSVIDVRGKALDDENAEDAVHNIVARRYGSATKIIAPLKVHSDYVKRKKDQKRIIVNSDGVTNGTFGQRAQAIQTQAGLVDLDYDIYMDPIVSATHTEAATSATNSPASPTIDPTTPIAVVTDTSTKFGDGAGNYFYGVRARKNGELSAMVMFDASAQAVSATQAVDLKFTITNNANVADSFVIYRSEKDSVDGLLYPIIEVSVAEHLAGYDGAAANTVRDKNRVIANTHSAYVLDPTSDIWEYLELPGGVQKLEYAITTPSKRFSVFSYGAPVFYQPGKVARIRNIGSDLS